MKSLPIVSAKVNPNYKVINQEVTEEITSPYYWEHEASIVIPFYNTGSAYIFLPDSEYFLWGRKVFLTPDIYSGIQMLTQSRVESDQVKALLKYVDPDTSYIYVRESRVIYNLNGDYLYIQDAIHLTYIAAMHILDTLNQPYPKGFLLTPDGVDPLLLALVARHDFAYTANTIISSSFLDGKIDLYRNLGIIDFCNNPSLQLYINVDKRVIIDVIPKRIERVPMSRESDDILHRIIECSKTTLIQPLVLSIQQGDIVQHHAIIMVLNIPQGKGYIFDSSYLESSKDFFATIYNLIRRFLQRFLREIYPELIIRSMSDFSCPFVYSFQGKDKNCRSWSFYLGILSVLNPDLSSEQLVETLYRIGYPGISIVIPRFLIGVSPEGLISMMHESYIQSDQKEVAIPEIPPLTLEQCQELLTSWGWQVTPLLLEEGNWAIVTGEASGIVVLTITPEGLDYWNQLIVEQEMPVTLLVTNADNNYYFAYAGTEDIPNLALGNHEIIYHSNDDWVPSFCFDGEIIEGFEDQPIITPMPNWLYLFLKEALSATI